MELHLFNSEAHNFISDLKMFSTAVNKNRNISKSYTKNAMALCVSYETKTGIDIEEKKLRSGETLEHFAKKFHTFHISAVPPVINELWFYKAWTGMESYFKLTGEGFGAQKDFTLDVERQVVARAGINIAWLEYFEFKNFIICVCGSKKISKEDVKINLHGWED
jgi:phosphopantetheinyl transferase